MLTLEYIILGFAYTSLSIALFLQVLCFRRKMESIESIAFTVSLLLLIVSISLSPLYGDDKVTTPTTLLCMVLVSVTTFLSTLNERRHAIGSAYVRSYVVLSIVLTVGVLVATVLNYLELMQYVVVSFLILSILVSMTIVRLTKPIKQFEYIEKVNRTFALIFFVIVPVFLIFHYFFEAEYKEFQIGFLMYLAFAALASSKIYYDLQRLSLIGETDDIQKQQLQNYGLTEREEEVAILLTKGTTYKSISEQLFISIPTVKTHASSIYKKCRVNSRNELTYLLNR